MPLQYTHRILKHFLSSMNSSIKCHHNEVCWLSDDSPYAEQPRRKYRNSFQSLQTLEVFFNRILLQNVHQFSLCISCNVKFVAHAKSINSLSYLEIVSTNNIGFDEVDLIKYREIRDWYENPKLTLQRSCLVHWVDFPWVRSRFILELDSSNFGVSIQICCRSRLYDTTSPIRWRKS